MDKKNIIEWLKKTDIPLTTISKKTKISRKTIYNWINGGEVRKKSLDKIIHIYRNEINLVNNTISLEGNKMEMVEEQKNTSIDASYVINLQKKNIEILEDELDHLKTVLNDNPVQNKQWTEIDADFCTDVEVTINAFSPKQRRITNMRGMDSIKHLLQLTDKDEKRIWREDDWFEYEEHPCNQIIEKESLEMLQKETKAMPSLLESLNFFIGNYYMVIPVIYNYNNQRVVTHCYIKIGWKLKPITIFTKNVIIRED